MHKYSVQSLNFRIFLRVLPYGKRKRNLFDIATAPAARPRFQCPWIQSDDSLKHKGHLFQAVAALDICNWGGGWADKHSAEATIH
jgi:hypothetical protein